VEELELDEWDLLFRLVHEVSCEVASGEGVDGVNIGINSGEAAGQTVAHAHVHIISRRISDVSDPRGGVRWVLPETADCWSGKRV
jgi:diadenosine tetraphosphate (Ap4A) HIT family hydrolase